MFAVSGRRAFLASRIIYNFNYETIRSSALGKKDSDVVHIFIIGSSGQQYKVQGNEGWSIVQAVQKSNLLGEFQDFGVCFGTSFCQTCHVYFKPGDFNKIPKLEEDSDELFSLEEIPNYIPGSSRLACHVNLQKLMNNMEVRQPRKCVGSKIVPP